MKRLLISLATGICLILTTGSCEEELVTIGDSLVGEEPFANGKAVYDVFAFNRNIEAVPTNQLSIYQLGVFSDPIYGSTQGGITTQISLVSTSGAQFFGRYTQSREDTDPDIPDENETIKEVILYLPYFQNQNADNDLDGVINSLDADPDDPNSDSDDDGLTDRDEQSRGTDPLNPDKDDDGIGDAEDEDTPVNIFPQRKELDSIYGNRDAQFNFEVVRSSYFLRDLDPGSGFQQEEPYYSNQVFGPEFYADELYEGILEISDEEILVFEEDDPDTEEDESLVVAERIQPGIRVALDPDFFQTNFLDKEGDPELLSNANFKEFIRGLHLSLTPIDNDLMILFDLTRARLNIDYFYDTFDDDEVNTVEATQELRLLTGGGNQLIQGNAVNRLVSDPYPGDITDAITSGENRPEDNASRIYLKGGAGTYAEIELFDLLGGGEAINEIKEKNWVINEASLVFYVDRERLDASGVAVEPPRLNLFNAETNQPLYNIRTETNIDDTPFDVFLNFGGLLERSGDKGVSYKIRITEHINNIIIRDSVNATLGLMLATDIRVSALGEVLLPENTEKELPVGSGITPLGTVLYGSNVDEADPNRLRLEIYYTEIDP